MIGEVLPYSVEAEFTNYPLSDNSSVSTAIATADVEFDNPCLDPFTFEATPQTNPPSDAYSQDDIVFNLNKFTIDPPRCKILYSCTGVVRVDGADSDIICEDLQVTGLFVTEQETTGTLSLTATSDNYTDMDYAPGTYTVTITGTATKSGQT